MASLVAISFLAWSRYAIRPDGELAWAPQLFALFVVIIAAVGRTLLGHEPQEDGRAANSSRMWVVVPLLLVASVAPFAGGIWLGFLSDDFNLLATAKGSRTAIEAVTSVPWVIFFRPVSMFFWWLGVLLWDGEAVGYHLLSMVLHAANVCLVYTLGRRLTGSLKAALFGSLLFAVHPLRVEPVVWIAARPDLLCAMFCLLSLLLLDVYARHDRLPVVAIAASGSVISFALALLSKEAALALPGVAALLLGLFPGRRARVHSVAVVASYGIALGAYLLLRIRVFGSMAGYDPGMNLWNTWFPSALLRQLSDFLFPVHRELVGSTLGPVGGAALTGVMALAALWWIQGLVRIPSQRLLFWCGYLAIIAIPTWTIYVVHTGNLDNSRLTYLPSIGLAWLFGDLCRGAGGSRGARAAIPALMVLFAAALSVWYVMPWRQAAGLRDATIQAGTEMWAQLPPSPPPRTVFVEGIPETLLGAKVWENCYQQELSHRSRGRVMVVSVSEREGTRMISPELLAASTLFAGEYVVAWKAESKSMDVVRVGAVDATQWNEVTER